MTNQPVAAAAPLRHEMFAAEVGTVFAIRCTDAQFDLALRELTQLKHHNPLVHTPALF